MDAHEIMQLQRELTDDEILLLEQALLNAVRELHDIIEPIAEQVATQDPELAARLYAASASMLANTEAAAAVPPERGD